jgi:hypothetical protein
MIESATPPQDVPTSRACEVCRGRAGTSLRPSLNCRLYRHAGAYRTLSAVLARQPVASVLCMGFSQRVGHPTRTDWILHLHGLATFQAAPCCHLSTQGVGLRPQALGFVLPAR